LETVGEILREEREKKGLSLKDVETAISIRSLYLKSIEEGNYSIIPGEVYLKGFIRNYANYLGLNGQEMVDLYRKSQLPSPTPIASVPSPVEPPQTKPTAPVGKLMGKRLLILILLIIIVTGAWWIMFASAPRNPDPPAENKPVPTAPSQPAPGPTPIPLSSEAKQITKPVVLIAKFTDQCWTLITVDGKEVYEGIPKNGETLTWEAQQNIVMTLGNASAVDLIYNGQNLGKPGGKGEVVTKTFSVNTVKKP
jgi:cytoskeletal protein RodZ